MTVADSSEPWLDRPDWRVGRIESSRAPLLRALVFAILWNLLTWPAAYVVWLRITDEGRIDLWTAVRANPAVFIFLLFPVIAVVSAVLAIRRVADALRFGRSLFTMHSVPAVIGGHLNGAIRAPGLRLRGDEDVLLRLECRATESRKRIDPGHSGGQSVSERVEWKNDHVVSARDVTDLDGAGQIPVQLGIPSFCRQTAETVRTPGRTDTFSWWLVARVEPRHGWNAEFEVPVFRTAAGPPAPEPAAEAAAGRSAPGPVPLKMPEKLSDLRQMSIGQLVSAGEDLQRQQRSAVGEPAVRPAGSRIVVHPPDSDGVFIEYPAAPLFLAVAAWWIVTLPLYVVLPMDLLHLHWLGPIGSLVLALAVNGVPGYFFVYYWPRRLLIGPRQITLFCGLPLFGARRRIPTSDAGEVKVDADRMAIVRKGETSIFKRWFFIAPSLSSDAEARWLASEIERALARYR